VKTIIMSTALFLCTVWPSMAKTGDSLTVVKSPTKAVLYSLVPGGGQWYNGKYGKAVLLFCGAAALTTVRTYGPDRQTRENASWWLVGLYIYNLLDAYVDAHLYHFDEQLGEEITPRKVTAP
jgi:hypothetical protein